MTRAPGQALHTRRWWPFLKGIIYFKDALNTSPEHRAPSSEVRGMRDKYKAGPGQSSARERRINILERFMPQGNRCKGQARNLRLGSLEMLNGKCLSFAFIYTIHSHPTHTPEPSSRTPNSFTTLQTKCVASYWPGSGSSRSYRHIGICSLTKIDSEVVLSLSHAAPHHSRVDILIESTSRVARVANKKLPKLSAVRKKLSGRGVGRGGEYQ